MNEINNKNDFANIKKQIIFFLSFWRLILLSIIICLFFAFVQLRYTHDLFDTYAKIKILDEKENSLELPSADNLFNKKINLQNEIELIKSYPILKRVCLDLNLTTQFYVKGNILNSRLINLPFHFKQIIKAEEISSSLEYHVEFSDNNITISDILNDTIFYFKNSNTEITSHSLPFNVSYDEQYLKNISQKSFIIFFTPINEMIENCKKNITVGISSKDSEILKLSYKSSDKTYSEQILNTLIKSFDNDGVEDRQLIHKRTIEFINDRFLVLSDELDSIELSKEIYKSNNQLIDFKLNSNLSLSLSSSSNLKIINVQNEIYITQLLIDDFELDNLNLIPNLLGSENTNLNILINDYNERLNKFKEFKNSTGSNHPNLKSLKNRLQDSRINIKASLDGHLDELIQKNKILNSQNINFNNDIKNLPKKEKILRSIERNQVIKESLFLYLLQKREEAEVSYAVTEPTLKVVEFAISDFNPVYPRVKVVYVFAFIFGLLFPILVLYIFSIFNTKIFSKNDLVDLNLGDYLIGEIPNLNNDEKKIFDDPTDRTVLAESFRMLTSNLKYLLPNNDNECNVILSTSTIKGEGKTFNAINLSLALASLDKKVLLIGCDLRNPQLHKYINCEKSDNGLVNYLFDSKIKWRDFLIKGFSKMKGHDILISGALPPNPSQLI